MSMFTSPCPVNLPMGSLGCTAKPWLHSDSSLYRNIVRLQLFISNAKDEQRDILRLRWDRKVYSLIVCRIVEACVTSSCMVSKHLFFTSFQIVVLCLLLVSNFVTIFRLLSLCSETLRLHRRNHFIGVKEKVSCFCSIISCL